MSMIAIVFWWSVALLAFYGYTVRETRRQRKLIYTELRKLNGGWTTGLALVKRNRQIKRGLVYLILSSFEEEGLVDVRADGYTQRRLYRLPI